MTWAWISNMTWTMSIGHGHVGHGHGHGGHENGRHGQWT